MSSWSTKILAILGRVAVLQRLQKRNERELKFESENIFLKFIGTWEMVSEDMFCSIRSSNEPSLSAVIDSYDDKWMLLAIRSTIYSVIPK